MILPHADSEGASVAANRHKIDAKTLALEWGAAIHCTLTKRARLPDGIAGLDEGHMVWGYYAGMPAVGERFLIARYNTCGREQFGYLETSPVTDVTVTDEGFVFATQNSVYQIELTVDPLST